ncbi:MAG: right-handed parallel beta-helix repeat-containing protein [Pseudomonadota bacterium]
MVAITMRDDRGTNGKVARRAGKPCKARRPSRWGGRAASKFARLFSAAALLAGGLGMGLVASTASSGIAMAQQIEFPPPGALGRGTGSRGGGSYKVTGGVRVYTVDQSGGRGVYKTIMGAVNAAPAGSIIRVMPTQSATGIPYTYKENLFVSEAVRIESALINFPITVTPDAIDAPCLLVSGKTTGLVEISDIQFVPTADYRRDSCVVMNGGVLTLRNVRVLGSVGIEGTNIIGSGFSYQPGFVLAGGFSRLEDVEATGTQMGLLINHVPGATYFIRDSQFHHNVNGVRLIGPAAPDFHTNQVYQNVEHGVVAVNGGGNYVSNRIERNGANGIFMQQNSGSVPMQIVANIINDNAGAGIRLLPGAVGTIGGNAITNNLGGAVVGSEGSTQIIFEPPNTIVDDVFTGGGGFFSRLFGSGAGADDPNDPDR